MDFVGVIYEECLMLVDFYTEGRHPEWVTLRTLYVFEIFNLPSPEPGWRQRQRQRQQQQQQQRR